MQILARSGRILSVFLIQMGVVWAQPTKYVTSIQETTFDNQSVEALDFIVLNPGIIVTPATTESYLFFISPAPCYTTPAEDITKSWKKQTSYDLDGNVTQYSITYSDYFGRPIQSQAKNIVENKVFASEIFYNTLGKAVLSTLPSPSLYCDFTYLSNFTQNVNGVKYSTSDFDKPVTSANAAGEPFNPITLGTAPVTTGWYYSTSNEFEPLTAVSNFPYTMMYAAYQDVVSKGGTALATNFSTGTPQVSATLPVLSELNHYATKSSYYSSNARSLPANLEGTGFTKNILRDANGIERVEFYDPQGRVVAKADVDYSATAFFTSNSLPGTRLYRDIHLTANNLASLAVTCATTVNVINLQNGLVIYTGVASSINTSSWKPGYYRVKSADGVTNVGVTFNTSYTNFAYFYYNEAGQLITEITPKYTKVGTEQAVASTYVFNSLGKVLRTTNPNQGTTEFVYRKDGQTRFAKNSKQQAVVGGTVAIGGVNYSKTFSYTNYDRFARPIESGEYQGGNSGTGVFFVFQPQDATPATITSTYESALDIVESIPSSTINLDAARCAERLYTNYTTSNPTAAVLTVGTTSYVQHNVAGRVGSTQNSNNQTWVSYDVYDRLEWVVQNIAGLGYVTLDYTYNLSTGDMLNVAYQKGKSDQFYHAYTYDKGRRLTAVQTSLDGTNWQTEAVYKYYLHGPIKRVELAGNVQGVDYIYTVDGLLKSMNHFALDNTNDPGKDGYNLSPFSKDIFGMTFNYYDNDYVSAAYNPSALTTFGTFNKASFPSTAYKTTYANGSPYAIAWRNAGNTSQTLPLVYNFSYDTRYWLTNAKFGTLSGTTYTESSPAVNNESGIVYDGNGNITSLTRGATTYGFTIPTTSDLLSSVSNYASAYSYSANGQTKSITYGSSQTSNLTYNSLGLLGSYTPYTNATTQYGYSERGKRLAKTSYQVSSTVVSGQTFYVRDLGGNVISTYYQSSGGAINQIEIPIYGLSRIAIAVPQTNSGSRTFDYNYEIQDHLGNTRARFLRTKIGGTSANIVYSSDYYPYGSNFNAIGSNIPRNTYAGAYAEKDNESNLLHFDLRDYDPTTGRWLRPDPQNQFYSPYLGMGNNPVMGFDPTGGFYWYLEALLYKLFKGGEISKATGGPGKGEWIVVNRFNNEVKLSQNMEDEVVIRATRAYNWGGKQLHFKFEGNVSLGAQIGERIHGWEGIEFNIGSIDLWSGEYGFTYGDNGFSFDDAQNNWIWQDQKVRQSFSADVPGVGGSYEHSFMMSDSYGTEVSKVETTVLNWQTETEIGTAKPPEMSIGGGVGGKLIIGGEAEGKVMMEDVKVK